MEWFASIDLYCERTTTGFWNEPLNAASNIAFIAAACWAMWTMHRLQMRSWAVWMLIALAFSIGVGSFLFHTFANAWSEQADVMPIWTFVALYILMSVHYFGGISFSKLGGIAVAVAALVLVGVWIFSGGVTTDTAESVAIAPSLLNGSQQYAPALIGLYAFVFFAYRRMFAERHWIGGAALAFTVSLAARTIDLQLCSVLPLGTHFLWHVLNGTMIALLLQAIIRHISHSHTGSGRWRRGPKMEWRQGTP